MRKIKVVVLLVRQLQHGFTKNAKVSPNLTVTHYIFFYFAVCTHCARASTTDVTQNGSTELVVTQIKHQRAASETVVSAGVPERFL